jgi:hypothetical protein
MVIIICQLTTRQSQHIFDFESNSRMKINTPIQEINNATRDCLLSGSIVEESMDRSRISRDKSPKSKCAIGNYDDELEAVGFVENTRQPRKEGLFDSLDSVHTSSSNHSCLLFEDWQDSDSDYDDCDGSFASLGSNDEDYEDAYREQRNAMAKLTLESTRPRGDSSTLTLQPPSRWMGRQLSVQGGLDLIAE